MNMSDAANTAAEDVAAPCEGWTATPVATEEQGDRGWRRI